MSKHVPERTCVATRDRVEKRRLLRLVLDESGRPHIDLLGRVSGRGVYVRPNRLLMVLRAPLGPKVFRGRMKSVTAEEAAQIVEETKVRCERRAVELVGLARRAGRCAIGFDLVASKLSRATDAVLIFARDVSPRTKEAVMSRCPSDVDVVDVGTCEEFGRMFSKERVGVVLVEHRALKESILLEAGRRAALDDPEPPDVQVKQRGLTGRQARGERGRRMPRWTGGSSMKARTATSSELGRTGTDLGRPFGRSVESGPTSR